MASSDDRSCEQAGDGDDERAKLEPWLVGAAYLGVWGTVLLQPGLEKAASTYVPARRAAANGSESRRGGASWAQGCGATCARGRICFSSSLVAMNYERNKGVREMTESSRNPVRRGQLIERMQVVAKDVSSKNYGGSKRCFQQN